MYSLLEPELRYPFDKRFSITGSYFFSYSIEHDTSYKFMVICVVVFFDKFSYNINSILSMIEAKNKLTGGINHKNIEFYTIMTDINLIFPSGFGATYFNAAIGGAQLDFTHSAFSYFYLKYGLPGFLLLYGQL